MSPAISMKPPSFEGLCVSLIQRPSASRISPLDAPAHRRFPVAPVHRRRTHAACRKELPDARVGDQHAAVRADQGDAVTGPLDRVRQLALRGTAGGDFAVHHLADVVPHHRHRGEQLAGVVAAGPDVGIEFPGRDPPAAWDAAAIGVTILRARVSATRQTDHQRLDQSRGRTVPIPRDRLRERAFPRSRTPSSGVSSPSRSRLSSTRAVCSRKSSRWLPRAARRGSRATLERLLGGLRGGGGGRRGGTLNGHADVGLDRAFQFDDPAVRYVRGRGVAGEPLNRQFQRVEVGLGEARVTDRHQGFVIDVDDEAPDSTTLRTADRPRAPVIMARTVKASMILRMVTKKWRESQVGAMI